MQLVKLISHKSKPLLLRGFMLVFLVQIFTIAIFSQDNSPYSRYGLGNVNPPTNVLNRGLGGVAAGYNDYFVINYNNPATYAFFQSQNEVNSKKLSYGRAVLNVGIANQTRTLLEPSAAKERFSSNTIQFSHLAMGVPLRKNWGIALGLRPLYSTNYSVLKSARLTNPLNNQSIDTSLTQNEGKGAINVAFLGTGFKFKLKNDSYLSFGINGGYMFGKKENATRLSLFNDSTLYESANRQINTNIGGLYFDAGSQLQFKLNKKLYMGIGAYGSWKQKINAKRDVIAETYTYDETNGYLTRDSVSSQNNISGNISYPGSYTIGFIIQNPQLPGNTGPGWLIGMDITRTNWDQYRYYGSADTAVKSNWQLKLGAELRPVRKQNYMSNAAYRFGFFTGPDYVHVGKALNTYGFSIGLGLPLANYNFAAKGQVTLLDLSFEYLKRGTKDNPLKENLYRISLGFSLSDMWFIKRKYD